MRIAAYLHPCIGQYLVYQYQRRQVVLSREGQQFSQQVLRWGAFPLLILFFGVKEPQSLRAGQLEGQNAPWLAKPAGLTGRAVRLHTLLHIQLVEGKHCYPGPGRRNAASMLAKLLYRR
ncbi:MAG: hypothetical protein DDT27_01432 [Dehalococcoidia bacterium]|nr:hypothetical protein [Chloroflexota bacterium]